MKNLLSKSFKASQEYKGLTDDQKKFFDLIGSGKNVFLSGQAGTGKSYCVKMLKSLLNESEISFGTTATTGVAALNIEGSTIHSWAGIGLGDEDAMSLIKTKVLKNRKASSRIENTDFLIVDEISMMTSELLDKLDFIFKYVRYNNLPFGGMQILFVGDFLQLPPVFKRLDSKNGFAFESRSWKEAEVKTHILNQVVRQKDSSSFVELLNGLRVGDTSKLDSILSTRINVKFPEDGIQPVKIFCKNIDVDYFNRNKLEEIKQETKTFFSIDTGEPHHLTFFDKNCPAPKILELKIGAQVMLLKNLDTENGFVNGSIGVVESFSAEGSVCVKFPNGKIFVDKEDWHIKEQHVGFDKRVYYKTVATRSQIPLKLSWASNVHKTQGMTLDRVELDLDEAFASGQIYVALSRVRNLESLSVKPFCPSKVKVDQKCLDFYKK